METRENKKGWTPEERKAMAQDILNRTSADTKQFAFCIIGEYKDNLLSSAQSAMVAGRKGRLVLALCQAMDDNEEIRDIIEDAVETRKDPVKRAKLEFLNILDEEAAAVLAEVLK